MRHFSFLTSGFDFFKVKHCKSVYKFDGEDPSEMSFAEGELIRVVKMSNGGWWKGQTKDEIGWFPSSYVMVRFMSCFTVSTGGDKEKSTPFLVANLYVRIPFHDTIKWKN